jgi:hypothetical protein
MRPGLMLRDRRAWSGAELVQTPVLLLVSWGSAGASDWLRATRTGGDPEPEGGNVAAPGV